MDIFPAFYPLEGRRVIIAGDGEPAESKARLFDASPAEVVRLVGERALDPAAYAGAALIFIASWDEAFAVAATMAARRAGVPVNVVDRPAMSDFHTPAIVDRGAVVAAIGTGGGAPVLASLLRAEIEARIPAGAGAVAALLGDRRAALRAALPDLTDRRSFFRAMLAGEVAKAAAEDDIDRAGRLLDAAIAKGWKAIGGVTFIALPPAADLLSLRAVRVLNMADVVVGGAGADAILGSHARRDAEHMTPDGVTAPILVELAEAGRRVALVGIDDSALLAALKKSGASLELLGAAIAS
jgi:precorrin-2 dehydrogenase/sirohydrochlorin ferrochelatase